MPDPKLADFTLPAVPGEQFNTADQRGKTLILYFYPKDNTPGCTNEAIAFRDHHEAFARLGAVIAGISRDSIKSHSNFSSKFQLPFYLLSDQDETICNQFGVMKMKNMYGKQVRGIERSTFVINQKGEIVKEWRGVKVPGHAEAVLEFVQTLQDS